MAEERTLAEKYNVVFGSNRYENCGNVITIKGKEVMRFVRGRDGRLLITAEVRGKTGDLIAKVVNNSAVYTNKFCKVEQSVNTTVISDKESGESLLEVRILDSNTLEVNGVFHVEGVTVIATKDGTYLPNGNVVAHSTFNNVGTGIAIN